MKAKQFLSAGRTLRADSITYMLRTCNADMSAHHNNEFMWPKAGCVEAPDWSPTAKCGAGLHGLLLGAGEVRLLSDAADAVWLVCAVWRADVVDLKGKVKVPRAYVVYAGTREGATSLLHRLGAPTCCYVTASAGDGSTLTAGAGSTLKAEHYSTLHAGYGSTLTAGFDSILTAGDGSTLTAGLGSTLTAGHYSKLQAGVDSKLTAGFDSRLTAGDGSTLTAGHGSTLTAGFGSTFRCEYWNGTCMRTAVAYVGESGIEPNVAYKCVDGKFLKVS